MCWKCTRIPYFVHTTMSALCVVNILDGVLELHRHRYLNHDRAQYMLHSFDMLDAVFGMMCFIYFVSFRPRMDVFSEVLLQGGRNSRCRFRPIRMAWMTRKKADWTMTAAGRGVSPCAQLRCHLQKAHRHFLTFQHLNSPSTNIESHVMP